MEGTPRITPVFIPPGEALRLVRAERLLLPRLEQSFRGAPRAGEVGWSAVSHGGLGGRRESK